MDLQALKMLRVTCAPGLTPFLEQEIAALGYDVVVSEDTGAEIEGTWQDAMRLNLHVRTGFSVLYPLDAFRCETADELYDRTSLLPWEEMISPDGYVSVVSHVDTAAINNSTFASLRVKDAIVDRIAEEVGRRPDAGPQRDRAVVSLYWRGRDCRLYFNTSGRRLADRGYRKIPHKAPMQETLAAGVVLATGYTGEQPLVNPMCGSGTLAIEAALIAAGRAPGLLRSNFSLMHTLLFDDESWQGLRRDARKQRSKQTPAPIIATDISEQAIAAARQNARTAGVEHLISFDVCDFADTPLPDGKGVIILNPEYGERMGSLSELESTYGRIGDWFKQECSGWTGYVFTGNLALAKKVGLRTSRRLPFFNARIECRLLKYEMYEGTRKIRAPRDES